VLTRPKGGLELAIDLAAKNHSINGVDDPDLEPLWKDIAEI
jgi:hypothetical protein